MESPMLIAAVRNNAEWCALFCREQGVGSRFEARAWRTLAPAPRFYPDAMTLSADATTADVLPAATSIKDSFATLDLAADGFTPLFDATWLHRRAAPPAEEPKLRAEWVMNGPDVAVLTVRDGATVVGGSILNRAAGVVGVSNLEGTDARAVWDATVQAAAELFPGLDLVGYEHGDDLPPALAAGFTGLGPLRVWIRT